MGNYTKLVEFLPKHAEAAIQMPGLPGTFAYLFFVPMPLPVPDYLDVAYRADLDVLLARWMRRVTLEEMQQGYRYLLDQAEVHACRYWLLDARRRSNTDREGAGWMVNTFLPSLHTRLGGRTYLAYLLVPVIMRDVEADAAFPPASFFADKPFVGERFIDEREAIAWLQAAHREPVEK